MPGTGNGNLMNYKFMDYFSSSYGECRDKFVTAGANAGAVLESFQNPARGPAGEDLFTDTASLGNRESDAALVLLTGIHGVEGYSGSGCLTAWLDKVQTEGLSPAAHVIIINLVNPYGTAWKRRVNENNVDLNRNFIEHQCPYPENPAYADLHPALVPERLDDAVIKQADDFIASYRHKHGDEQYWSAFNGQYTHPEGVFFGGRSEQWSNKLLQEILGRYCADKKSIAFMDFHSGLGPFGYGTLISADRSGSVDFQRAKSWYGESLVSLATIDSADGRESGQDKYTGHSMDAVKKMFPGKELTCCTLEFGTFEFDACLPLMREEAWVHLYGDPLSEQGKSVSGKWLDIFYPCTPDWLEMVWRRSDQVIRQALAGLGSHAG